MTKIITVETSYGEVVCRPNKVVKDVLDCYVGNNSDEYIGDITGTVDTDAEVLKERIEKELF